MESRVFKFFASFFSKLLNCFDESFCGKAYNRFCKKLSDEYNESRISKFFECGKRRDVFRNSFFGKICILPETILLFLQKKLADPVNSALKGSVVCKNFNRWADISIRFYGILLSVFSLLLVILKESTKTEIAILIGILILGIVMILINRDLNSLLCGSKIYTSLKELFTEYSESTHDFYACKKAQCVTAAALGIICAMLCLVFGDKLFVVLAGAILAFAFLLKYLNLGVFLTVMLSPLLPTMVLVGLSFLCATVFCIHVILNKDFTFSKNPMNAFVVFFMLALLWGCINSFSFAASLTQAAVHISFILFYFVLVNTIRKKEQWQSLIKMFLGVAFIVALYGVVQNFTGITSTQSWVDEEMFEDISVRVYSFFNNPNVLGEFLVMTIPLTLAVIWGKQRQTHKVLFLFVLIMMAACMVFTWSRGAWLGVFFALALFLVIMDRRWVLAGVLLLVLAPVLLTLSGNTAILQRLLSIGNTADTSTAYRVSIWQASIKIIRDFWVSGIGIGQEAYKSVYPVYALSGADFALHSHNLYLQVWVEMGIIGITSLFAVILMFVKQVFSKKVMMNRKTDSCAKIVVALGAALLGFLLQGLTDYVWYNYKILMIFWIVVALGISGVNLFSQNEEKGGDIK